MWTAYLMIFLNSNDSEVIINIASEYPINEFDYNVEKIKNYERNKLIFMSCLTGIKLVMLITKAFWD